LRLNDLFIFAVTVIWISRAHFCSREGCRTISFTLGYIDIVAFVMAKSQASSASREKMLSKFLAYGAIALVIGSSLSAGRINAAESSGHTDESHPRVDESHARVDESHARSDESHARADESHARADESKAHAEEAQALVVFVFDKSCKISCGLVRPVIRQLQEQYAGRVKFIELDVSKDSLAESKKMADSLGIRSYLQESEDWYPAVAFFSANHKMVKELLGARSKELYKAGIEKALTAR
jgi:hypothetical protein